MHGCLTAAVSSSTERGWARFESTTPAAVRYRDFMGWDVPWYSAQAADALLAGRRFAAGALPAARRQRVRDLLEQRPRL